MYDFCLQFAVTVLHEEEEGLYNLYFHNCLNFANTQSTFDLSVSLSIKYLSHFGAINWFLQFNHHV